MRRQDRFELRRGLWAVSKLKRVRACGRWRINADDGVPVVVQGDGLDGDRAHFANLQQCASIWACPVCSAKIRHRRAGEIEVALRSHLREGGRAFLVTLTVPHDRGQPLDDLLSVVSGGWSRVISGRAWAGWNRSDGSRVMGDREACGVVGTIRSLEVTTGDHGWHPHLHVLVLVEGDGHKSGRSAAMRRHARLINGIRSRWEGWTVEQGLRRPSDRHGVRVDEVRSSDVARYVGKVQDGWASMELARSDLKGGRRGSRTPFEVLRDAMATGDTADVARWHEYERASRGRQAITWSAGLRGRFELDELTDEEAASIEVGGEPICVVPPDLWRELCARPGALPRLLAGAENAGVAGVAFVLREFGLSEPLWRPPPRPVEVGAPSG